MKMLLSTQEGYPKDRTDQNKKKFREKQNNNFHIHFSGNDAPVKMVKALMQKFGITPDQLKEDA
jgi:hypothetical protein